MAKKVKSNKSKAKSKVKSKVKTKAKVNKSSINIGDKLPRVITIDGVEYNTPSYLYGIKHDDNYLGNDFRLLVYSIKKRTKTKLTLQAITNGLFRVRDNYIQNDIKPDKGTFDSHLLESLKIQDGYLPRSESANKLITIHNSNPNIKRYRFHCFECRRVGFFGYANTSINIDQELNLFFEAREEYLRTVDESSIIFNIYYAYEKYTNYVIFDFSKIQVDHGNLEAFKKVLKDIIKLNEYGDY